LYPLSIFGQLHSTFLSIEGGGTGMIASINIGKTLFVHSRYKIIFQSGLGWSPKINSKNSPFNIPCQLTCNFGNRNSFFEAGLGVSLLIRKETEKSGKNFRHRDLYLTPIVGIRHETERWFARVYLSPFFNATGKSLYDEITSTILSFGIAIGLVL
jgi:hypothetical protein